MVSGRKRVTLTWSGDDLGAVLRWDEHALVTLEGPALVRNLVRVLADLLDYLGRAVVVLAVFGLTAEAKCFILAAGGLVEVDVGCSLRRTNSPSRGRLAGVWLAGEKVPP